MDRRQILTGGAVIGVAGLLTGLGSARAARAAPAASGKGLVIDGLDPSVLTRDYVQMQQAAGVDCWHKSLGDLKSFAAVYNFVDQNSDIVRVVRSVREIEAAKADKRLGLLLGWQDSNPVANNRDGPNDWWSTPRSTELRAYYELGLRIAGIAYQIANVFGGGGQDAQLGLSRAGRSLVEEIHHLKIVLDVGGHTGDQATLDAIAMSSGVPVICSHAGVRHHADSTRNLSDAVIDKIAGTGGVIGIAAINDFLVRGRSMANVEPSPQGTIADFVRHATYVKQRVGAQHVGWGPDFTFGAPGRRDYAVFGPEVIDKSERRFVSGFENVSQLPNVPPALKAAGWTDAEIRGFMGENWIRVYRQVWGQ